MRWYNILRDNEGSISNILRLDSITVGYILIAVKLVTRKRVNYEPILAVIRTERRQLVYYFGQIIKANLSRVEK